jgi:hypothetical protein
MYHVLLRCLFSTQPYYFVLAADLSERGETELKY